MKKLTRYYSHLIAAALVLALLCVSGCTGGETATADEDNSFTYFEEYAEYDNEETLNSALELAKILGDSWYGNGDSAADSSDDNSWLLDYAVSAHTQDGRGIFALHIPGSAGMSQVDFILLTTKDYGRTWIPSGGVYHIAGDIAQIAINEDHVYMIINSYAYGNSCVLMSEDFCSTFKVYNTDHVIPSEYRTRISELYNVYMRIVNVESDGEIVLECYCDGYMEGIDSDVLHIYESSVISDKKRVIMILSSDSDFSRVKTLYTDESIF